MAEQKVGYEAQKSVLRHVDLCSGIGGFALGFQWAELSRPVLFCDIEPWSRKVLRKHWPDVPIAEDVKELANETDRLVPDCDILTAGYPCQPFSVAGDRRGTKDDRHIWPEIFTIIKRKRPTFCVFENVYGHISMGLDEVLSDLERENYATRPFVIPAVAVDAPHRRDRVWIIARNVGNTQHNGSSSPTLRRKHKEIDERSKEGEKKTKQSKRTSEPRNHEIVENTGHRTGRHKWVAETGQDPSGEWATHTSKASRSGKQSETMADTKGLHSNVSQKHSGQGQRQEPQLGNSSGSDNVANADSSRQQKQRRAKPTRTEHKAPECGSWWKPEPPVGRVAHGISSRVDRLRGLGNAVVPQIAQRIGETIKNSI